MARLTLQSIRKSFGSVEVLHGIDLNVEDGELVVLVGPSGCGKSTLLRLIAGLDTITSGSFLMDGSSMNHVNPAKRGIGMVFQSYALYPHMTVHGNISFGLRLQKVNRDEIDRRVNEVAKVLQLEGLLDRKPKSLSGGQRQRVAIGRALIQKPKVFLFDEPLSNLDAKLRVSMRVEISKLHKALKSTSIYVTHDQIEALTLADRVVVMNNGVVEQIGTPLELYHHPANLFVGEFIGSPKMNFMLGKISKIDGKTVQVKLDGGFVVTAKADMSSASVGDRVTFGVRPENLVEGNSRSNVIEGTVELAEHLGELTYLYAEIAGIEGNAVVKVEGTAAADDGDKVTLSVHPDDCYLFDAAGIAYPRVAQSGKTRSATIPVK